MRPCQFSLSVLDADKGRGEDSPLKLIDRLSFVAEVVGTQTPPPLVSQMAETPNSNSFRAAIAFSVSAAVWSVAVNVLNQKYGASIPDWTIVVAIYIAAAFWCYWAWHTEFVRRRQPLIYTYRRMGLIVMVLAGIIIGGGAGWFLWWTVQREQRAQAQKQLTDARLQAPAAETSTPAALAAQSTATPTAQPDPTSTQSPPGLSVSNSSPSPVTSAPVPPSLPSPSAQTPQEVSSLPEAHFRSRYTPITDTADTAISFISDMRGSGTSGRLIRFKARIGFYDHMIRLVIDLPKGNEYDAALYAVEHRKEILDRVRADIRAAHPDLLEVPVDAHMILQHHSDHEYMIGILGRLRGKAEFLIEARPK